MDHIETVARIVSAYLTHNASRPDDIPALLADVHKSIVGLGKSPEPPAPERRKPAHDLSIKKTITHEALISYLDGRGYKTLRRHVATHGMTMDQYREEFGLPKDYPSVAAGYSERRSALARSFDLGHTRGRKAAAEVPAPTVTEKAAPKKAAKKVSATAEKKVTPHLKPKDRKKAAEASESVSEAA